ncbi:hypothetical protein [Lacticaseibacillus sp. N501-2]|uniref:hypothetical protein n=1 Tax=Lacticaseibacillus salsurae TaxID=3367729 RepID=UPI0038B36C49
MPKWLVSLVITTGLLASTGGQSIAQFELRPEMPATQGNQPNTSSSASSQSPTASGTKTTAANQRFPQVGEGSTASTFDIFWIAGISGIWIWQGGRRHAH